MPEYTRQIDAGEAERKTFLDGFNSSARRDLRQWKVVNANEQSWLQTSVGLYNFALARQGAYSIEDAKVVFKQRTAAADFARKLELAKLSRFQFLSSHGRYIATQNAYLAQLGLPPVLGGRPSGESWPQQP